MKSEATKHDAANTAQEAPKHLPTQAGEQPPSVGHVVHYKLRVADLMQIGDLATKLLAGCNRHEEGDVLPAVIVRVFNTDGSIGAGACNLKVMVDGNVPDLWVTSALRGDGNGQWNWPARV